MANKESKTQRVEIVVSGRVQGVCFRAFTREEVLKLGLVGWVRNCGDDKVEIVAEGLRETLDRLIVWTHKGPPTAHVEKVAVEWKEATGEFNTFEVRRSA